MNFLEGLITYAMPAITILIQVGICAVIVIGIMFLNKALKSKGIDIFNNQLINIEDLVLKVVKYLNQTVVDKLKEESEDGKLTDEQIAEIQNNALSTVMKLLNSDTMTALAEKYGEQYIDYLKVLIENAVVQAKEEKNQLEYIEPLPLIEC